MTEPYKPWEGKHFLEAHHKIRHRVEFIQELYPEYAGVDRYVRGLEYSHDLLWDALKKDWDEQRKDYDRAEMD